MTDSLTKFIVTANQSMSVVENPTFLSFLESFRMLSIDNYEKGIPKTAKDLIPSRTTIKNHILDAMESKKTVLLEHIQQLKDNGGSLTLDFCKNGVDYLAVTAHYISNRWEKINFIILFLPVPGDMKKTTRNIEELILENLSRYGISSKDFNTFFVTTDEGANVLPLGGLNHISCLAHIGSTIAKRTTLMYRTSPLNDGDKLLCSQVTDQITKMQKLVAKLKENQHVMSKASKALKFPIETRYLSTYNMVTSGIKNLDLLKRANEEIHDLPELEELITMLESESSLSHYLTVLQPVNEMVKVVQEEKEPTASKMILHIANIWLQMQNNLSQQNHCIHALTQAMQYAFNKKIGDLSDPRWLEVAPFNIKVAVTSAFLDPLVHSQLLYLCNNIPGLEYEKMKEIVRNVAKPFLTQQPPCTSSKKVMFPQQKTVDWIYKPVEVELNMYINMPKHTDDALKFWEDVHKVLPILAKVAQRYLELRYLVSDFTRNRMHPELNATLVHLRDSYLKEKQ